MKRIKKLEISQKNKVKMIQKSEIKNQSNCSAADENISDQRLDDSGCQNILFNCLNNLGTRVTEIFD